MNAIKRVFAAFDPRSTGGVERLGLVLALLASLFGIGSFVQDWVDNNGSKQYEEITIDFQKKLISLVEEILRRIKVGPDQPQSEIAPTATVPFGQSTPEPMSSTPHRPPRSHPPANQTPTPTTQPGVPSDIRPTAQPAAPIVESSSSRPSSPPTNDDDDNIDNGNGELSPCTSPYPAPYPHPCGAKDPSPAAKKPNGVVGNGESPLSPDNPTNTPSNPSCNGAYPAPCNSAQPPPPSVTSAPSSVIPPTSPAEVSSETPGSETSIPDIPHTSHTPETNTPDTTNPPDTESTSVPDDADQDDNGVEEETPVEPGDTVPKPDSPDQERKEPAPSQEPKPAEPDEPAQKEDLAEEDSLEDTTPPDSQSGTGTP